MARFKKYIISTFLHLELILVSLIVLIPIFWIVISSFNASSGLASATLIPEKLTVNNYVKLFTETKYVMWFGNTLKIAIVNSAVYNGSVVKTQI